MKLLLDDEYAPITSQIGFLEVDPARAIDAYASWQQQIQAERGVKIERREVAGPLAKALESLLPLTTPERRRTLLVPTKSAWTAYFDNGNRGTDAFPPMSHLAQELKCRALKLSAVPDTKEARGNPHGIGRYGAIVFELYGPEKTDWLNFVRAVSLTNQGKKWEFTEQGTPLPFEDTSAYKARKVKERFSFEALDRYAKALGISPFDEGFYLPPERPKATLVEKVGPANPNLKELSLAEARAKF
jgi:hypothetical protein